MFVDITWLKQRLYYSDRWIYCHCISICLQRIPVNELYFMFSRGWSFLTDLTVCSSRLQIDRTARQLLMAGNFIGNDGVRNICVMLKENEFLNHVVSTILNNNNHVMDIMINDIRQVKQKLHTTLVTYAV